MFYRYPSRLKLGALRPKANKNFAQKGYIQNQWKDAHDTKFVLFASFAKVINIQLEREFHLPHKLGGKLSVVFTGCFRWPRVRDKLYKIINCNLRRPLRL